MVRFGHLKMSRELMAILSVNFVFIALSHALRTDISEYNSA
jgi:hypothetical protein